MISPQQHSLVFVPNVPCWPLFGVTHQAEVLGGSGWPSCTRAPQVTDVATNGSSPFIPPLRAEYLLPKVHN